jgi:hypothetical protein
MVPGKHCIFSTYLANRARAQSKAYAEVQFHDYGTVLWTPSSRNGSRKAGKHCDFSTYLINKERELSLALWQRCVFLIMEQCCGSLAVEIIPGKHCDFSTYLAKRARNLSGVCAEGHFPDYGKELWSPGSRNCSKKALRFQHLYCQESGSSFWIMRRGEVI